MLLGQLDRQLGAPTPKLTGGMTGTPRSKTMKPRKLNLLTQNLQVAHQRVNIDLDFCTKRLSGYTELTIVPTSSLLRCVKLDAREMKIRRVLINGSELADYVYNDQLYINDPVLIEELAARRVPNVRDVCSKEFGVAQHHILRKKLNYLFGQIEDDQLRSLEKPDNLNSEELLILLPENLKLQQADPSALHTPTSLAPTNMTPLLFRNRLAGEVYSPIQIIVEYEVINPKNGLNFICPSDAASSLWHAYTTNSDYNVSTSSWVPCVDNLLERSIWSIELSIPRSVKNIEILRNKLKGGKRGEVKVSIKEKGEERGSNDENVEAEKSEEVANETVLGNGGQTGDEATAEAEPENDAVDAMDVDEKEESTAPEASADVAVEAAEAPQSQDVEMEDPEQNKEKEPQAQESDDEDDGDEIDSIDLFVCTGDSNNTKESAHPTDISKKVVSWSIFNPVAAHHIGWSVGAFQSVELSNFVDGNLAAVEEDEAFDDFEEIGKDESSPAVNLYFLPGQEELAKNTCIFASQALDFFLKEYGSYPFSSYGVVFVDGPKHPYNNFAGLSVLNSSILYPADVIEPMFEKTEDILECIACQWSGINIVPQCFNDIWCTIGIAKFMTFQFLKLLMGVNEYRYRIKNKMDAIVKRDTNQRPIGLLSLQAPVAEDSLEFVRLKAPIILFILDRRMTKTDKSFGFSRVLPKLFLQAMSGDLQSGALSTQHFLYVCEKVYRNPLDKFFKQWVYGVGTPAFTITQKFNKKKSMIEVVIRQTQLQQHKAPHPKPETFITDAMSYLNGDLSFPIQQTFEGPMTIRVHEADGTPYEHIVLIKTPVIKFDVQYNTKFKRLKKSKEEADGLLFSRLGDVLEKPDEVKEWRFEEWPKRDDELLDPFEWLRVDTDFEWIGTFNVVQPDYMYGAQLQQDRDIEAQIAAIDYFGRQEKPNPIYCTMLTRTLVDSRYFYGVRMAAAKALAKFSNSANKFVGRFYLLKAFRLLFCFKDSLVPVSNSFEDFGKFFLQKAVPGYLAGIKDDSGTTPKNIQSLLFNLLRYNDNSNNPFLDCFYVSELARALVKSVVHSVDADDSLDAADLDVLSAEAVDKGFINEVVDELLRLRKLDRWVPSYQSEISYSCLEQKIALARAKLITMSFEELLYLTSTKYASKIRALAFKGLFLLGALRNGEILQYFLDVCLLEQSSPEFRAGLIRVLVDAVAEVAINGCPSTLDDPEFEPASKTASASAPIHGSAVVVEESLDLDLTAKRDALAKATVKGTIDLLRRDLAKGKGLRHILWQLLHTSLISLSERKLIFILCDILYAPEDTFVVRLPVPCVPFEELKKKIVAKDMGDGKMVIKREGRFKIQLSAKIILSDKPKMSLRRSESHDTTVGGAAPKLKLRLSALPAAEPPRTSARATEKKRESLQPSTEPAPVSEPAPIVVEDPLVSVNAFNMRVRIKLPKTRLSEIKPSRKPAVVRSSETRLTLRFTNEKHLAHLRDLAASVSPRPLRYVKINTRTRSVEVSATPFGEVSPVNSEPKELKDPKEPKLEPTEES